MTPRKNGSHHPPHPASESAEDAERTAGAPEAEAAQAEPVAGESAEALRDKWLRAEAELQNYRRRAQRDVEDAARFAEERVLLEMISLLDDLERALDSARSSGAPDAWVQGVQLVADRAHAYLARLGVQAMDAVGQPFDPERHEAMLEIDAPADVEPGHVAEVVRKGYERNRRALRPARVAVARMRSEV